LKRRGGIFFEGSYYAYADLQSDIFDLKPAFAKGSSVYLKNPSALEFLACVLSLGDHLGNLYLIPDGVKVEVKANEGRNWYGEGDFTREHLTFSPLHQRIESRIKPQPEVSSNLVIYSSGTSGPPKPISHKLNALISQYTYQKDSTSNLTWGLTFQPQRMSGIQVLLNAYSREENVVCTLNDANLETRVAEFHTHGVTAISATPSYIQLLSATRDFKNLKLQQITLGGEIVNQKLLDKLHNTFPAARITHIYASSEIGFGFSVSDLKSGFPEEFLEKDFGRFRLRSIQGELAIEFADKENPTNQEIFFTGDLVAINNQRVQFSGRRTSIVNVGGHKVSPEEVEQVILSLEGIQKVLVFGVKSSQLGEILIAKAVTDGKLSGQEIRIELKNLLPSYKIPASVEVVTEIKLNSTGKISRL
jgi:acyl-CoA synthetase (AMP-forming)/AMP-acid ligase II